MSTIFENWDGFITEATDTDIKKYFLDISMTYAIGTNLYLDITNRIRAIKGVTVVSVVEGTQKISKEQQQALLDVKFQIKRYAMVQKYITTLRSEIKKIPGVLNVRIAKLKRFK